MSGHPVAALLILAVLAGCGPQPVPAPKPLPTPTPSPSPTPAPTATPALPPTPTPSPTPTPVPWIPRKPLPTARLYNGLSLDAKVVPEESAQAASQERIDLDSYKVEVTVKCRLPRAAATLEDFEKTDPTLAPVFKDFPGLLANAKVSPFFEKIYSLKTQQVQREIGRLDVILSRHNFYDCETILECQNPDTGRRAILAVGDMDVNVDGSDGDRNVAVDASSQFFLPQTSYRWPKQTERTNPCLPIEEKRLASLKDELAAGKLTPARTQEVQDGIDLAKRRIYDLQKWSFLVAEVDPFIVLPGFMMRDKDSPLTPGVGDYALVLFGGRAYPAVVGDAGPSLKIGEASIRLCRELNPKSTALIRPVSDLKVAYLVFPGSADEKASPPDLTQWRGRCEQLASELGGLNAEIHSWPDIVKPWPTPTPSSTPEPTPSPTPEPMPTPSLEPNSTPSPTSTPTPSSTPLEIVPPAPAPEN